MLNAPAPNLAAGYASGIDSVAAARPFSQTNADSLRDLFRASTDDSFRRSSLLTGTFGSQFAVLWDDKVVILSHLRTVQHDSGCWGVGNASNSLQETIPVKIPVNLFFLFFTTLLGTQEVTTLALPASLSVLEPYRR